jgi:hypothetical protein
MVPPASKKRKPTEEKLTKDELKKQEKHLWIKWVNCPAKYVLMDDLKHGRLSGDSKLLSAEDAWTFYKDMPEFADVCFSQFDARLADHRKQVNKQWKLCQADEEAFRKDQKRGYAANTKSHNHRGELIIHLDPVLELIRDDINDGKHKGRKPSEFQATRPEFKRIGKTKFKERMYQEIKRKKFIFYCELKRQTKGRKVPASYKKAKQKIKS